MGQSVYKIGEVSARLGLVDKNNNTLRSWTEEFSEFLSALANPAAGQPRRFTERDVQILAAIRDYRANHLSFDEIRARLRAGEHDVTPPAPEPQHAAQPVSSIDGQQALVPATQLEALLAPLAASSDEWRRLAEEYRQRLEGREARIEALERRIDELYARLDATLPTARLAASADNGRADTGTGATEEASPARGAPSSNDIDNTHAVPEQQRTQAVSLFPLPVVEHREMNGGAAEPAGHSPTRAPSRRRWWRLWR